MIAEAREALIWAVDRGGLEAEVAEALLDGRCLEDVARDIYRDPVSRFRYWLGSESEAESCVLSAARRLGTRSRTA